MILEELVQHVEEVVLHQRLNHQLIQVMLENTQLRQKQEVCEDDDASLCAALPAR